MTEHPAAAAVTPAAQSAQVDGITAARRTEAATAAAADAVHALVQGVAECREPLSRFCRRTAAALVRLVTGHVVNRHVVAAAVSTAARPGAAGKAVVMSHDVSPIYRN
ncbi:hypothetical protein [Dyella sp.]|uniref:hypothetical protein n=1 Tax=Dyella sp. TaxID=1869338 RepID=UPI002D76FF9A|nr:hypothetical protein [Dyella sp.]HET6432197.1 hypothetical protein [Dyella sp.]